ncbi:MAG: lipocalin-like domain-containing protein [Xanthomonadaceae bacterium]|nr:lipocalin-like domain-containing protein [Xanthomonadaceae bacterium]
MKSIAGAYQLIEYKSYDANGKEIDTGTGFRGLLIYHPNSHMNVSIMRDQGSGTFGRDVIAYSGTYRTESEKVIHHVTETILEDYKNQELIRKVKIENDLLTLSTENKNQTNHVVLWKKIYEYSNE